MAGGSGRARFARPPSLLRQLLSIPTPCAPETPGRAGVLRWHGGTAVCSSCGETADGYATLWTRDPDGAWTSDADRAYCRACAPDAEPDEDAPGPDPGDLAGSEEEAYWRETYGEDDEEDWT